MKLIGVLKTLPPDRSIKVGCVDGTGWFYCGTVEDLTGRIIHYNYVFRCHLKQKYTEAKKRRAEFQQNEFSVDSFVKQQLKENHPSFTLERYQIHLMRCFKELTRLVELEKNAEKDLDLPALSSLVVENVFDADNAVDTDCTNILLAGNLRGAFWFKAEATKDEMLFWTPAAEEEQ